jgi:hypothetical protein
MSEKADMDQELGGEWAAPRACSQLGH